MPGIDRIKSLPAIRLKATDRLCEIARVTAEVWRPAPLRTKTGNAPKRPGPPRKVVIPKVKASADPRLAELAGIFSEAPEISSTVDSVGLIRTADLGEINMGSPHGRPRGRRVPTE